MKTFKRLLVGAVASVMAFGMAACGGGNSGDSSTGSGGGKKKDFELQIFSGGYGSEMWSYAVREFEKDHPEYNVQLYMSNTVNDSMADRWRNGNPPDFVFLDGTLDKNTWLYEGMLYDFTDWLKTAKVAGEDVLVKDKIYTEYAFKGKTYKGKTITYGMPLVIGSYGMWYDQSLFDEHNWTVPAKYSELIDFATNSATKDIPAMIYPGVYSGYLVQGLILPAMAEYGEEFFNRVENALDAEVFESAEFKDVMNRFANFAKITNSFSRTNDGKPGCLSMDHTVSQLQWLNRAAAFIPNGLWLRNEIENDIKEAKDNYPDTFPSNFEMKYTASPLVKEQQYIMTSSVTCGVAAEGDNKEAALEFITYLYRDNIAEKFAKCTNSPSVAKIELKGDDISDVLKYTQQVMNDPKYKHINHVGSWGGVDSVFNQGVNSIAAGTKTVDQVCKELADAAKKQLGK